MEQGKKKIVVIKKSILLEIILVPSGLISLGKLNFALEILLLCSIGRIQSNN